MEIFNTDASRNFLHEREERTCAESGELGDWRQCRVLMLMGCRQQSGRDGWNHIPEEVRDRIQSMGSSFP